MKRLYLNICIAVFSFLVVSCQKEEVLFAPSVKDATSLSLNVTAENFSPADGVTRALEEGYVTKFTNGDQIGVFAIKAGKTVLAKNIPYEFDGTSWKPVETGNTALHYNYWDDVSYFAYYPYSASMDDKKSEQEVIDSFKITNSDQGNYADFKAADLMTGAGVVSKTGDSHTLTFQLKHRMMMLVLRVDAYLKYEAPQGELYEYHPAKGSAPISNVKIAGYNPCDIGDGTYRLILPIMPNGISSELEFNYTLDGKSMSHTISVVWNNESGKYHELRMIHPNIIRGIRKMQVGDFYYNDGTVSPGDEPVDKENCIGVVFHVGPGEGDGINDYQGTGLAKKGKISGYVLALTPSTKVDENGNDITYWAEFLQGDRISVGTSKSITDFKGFSNTKLMLTKLTNSQAALLSTNYTSPNGACPAQCSGWYLGSGGQYMDAFSSENSSKIVSAILNAGGVDVKTTACICWTSTEKENSELNQKAYMFVYGVGTTASLMDMYKYSTPPHIWSILTF